jgi:hypothetical protein
MCAVANPDPFGIVGLMTRAQAEAEAERKQRTRPDATWIATQRGDEWVVACVGVGPNKNKPTGTAIKPPPETPHEAPLAPEERVEAIR